jgi:hypothetical protein
MDLLLYDAVQPLEPQRRGPDSGSKQPWTAQAALAIQLRRAALTIVPGRPT